MAQVPHLTMEDRLFEQRIGELELFTGIWYHLTNDEQERLRGSMMRKMVAVMVASEQVSQLNCLAYLWRTAVLRKRLLPLSGFPFFPENLAGSLLEAVVRLEETPDDV